MNAFDEMLADYDCRKTEDKLNALREVMQQVALCGLAQAGFFERAAFYGGTCLRIFHGVERFSEDMDFSLLQEDRDFDFTPYFSSVIDLFASFGQKVDISLKKKSKESAVQSAFLKGETAQFHLSLERGRLIKIKLEVDTSPPLAFSTENKLLLRPRPFYARCFTPSCLFAGKMHALLYRAWGNRVKGRDWYDFEWYVRKRIPLDFRHFQERAYQFESAGEGTMTPEHFRELLQEKIDSTDFDSAAEDVRPFLHHPEHIELWSADYFRQVADQMCLSD